jgi:hypothetical protein
VFGEFLSQGKWDESRLAAGAGPACCLVIELCGMGRSKIEMACGFTAGLPRHKTRGYAFFDSWHTCQAVVGAF